MLLDDISSVKSHLLSTPPFFNFDSSQDLWDLSRRVLFCNAVPNSEPLSFTSTRDALTMREPQHQEGSTQSHRGSLRPHRVDSGSFSEQEGTAHLLVITSLESLFRHHVKAEQSLKLHGDKLNLLGDICVVPPMNA
jgi:hypothetical protein